MKKLIILFAICILFQHCNLFKSEYSISDVQEDWVSDNIKKGSHSYKYTFSFEDTLCRCPDLWEEFSIFEIKDNTLFIYDSFIKGRKTIYNILKLDSDKMTLCTNTRHLHYSYEKYKEDTFTLYKVKQKNNLTPIKIKFYAQSGWGKNKLLEIDSNKNVLFYKLFHRRIPYPNQFDKGIGKKGILSSKAYSSIIKKIQQLPLDKIKESYINQGITDATVFGLILECKQKIIRIKYYVADIPDELDILFYRLFNIDYLDITFNNDSIDMYKFKANDSFYNNVLLPVPDWADKQAIYDSQIVKKDTTK